MKKNFLSKLIMFIFSLILISGDVLAQTAPLKLVRQQKSATEIRQWLWRQSDDGNIFPFLRATREKVEFLGADFQVSAAYEYLPLSEIKSSPNNDVVAFIERTRDKNDIEQRKFSYHVVRFDGREIFSVPYSCVADEPYPAIYVSDQGDALLVDGAKGEIKIFRGQPDPEKIIDLFSDDVYNFEKPIDAAMSGNGEWFSVVAQKHPSFFSKEKSNHVSGEPYLFLFSIDGEEQWRQPLEMTTGASTAISPSGTYVVASHYTPQINGAPELRTSIFSMDGKKILDVPLRFRFYKFSSNEKYLLLADTHALYRVDLGRKDYLRYQIIPAEENRLIVDFALGKNEKPAILTGTAVFATDHFEFEQLKILQLSKSQTTTLDVDFANETMIFPSIFVRKNQLAMGMTNGIKIFRDQREQN
ncbi:MAG: hypothetical protein GXO74_08950 [Calditrichaeota bacterium]|nr:hypothetical protein [Calditrichota bacterium]